MRKIASAAIVSVLTIASTSCGHYNQGEQLQWVDDTTSSTLQPTNNNETLITAAAHTTTTQQGRLYLTISAESCNNKNQRIQLTFNNNKTLTVSVPTTKQQLKLGDRLSEPSNIIKIEKKSGDNCGALTIYDTQLVDDGVKQANIDANPYLNYGPAYNHVYLDKISTAQQQTDDNPNNSKLDKLRQPTAVWLGKWSPQPLSTEIVRNTVEDGLNAGTTPTFVIYGIKGVDCNKPYETGYDETEYYEWLENITATIGDTAPVIIYEPDALPMQTTGGCKSPQGDRLNIMTRGLNILTQSNASIYIDAGHSKWLPADQIADKLNQVGEQNVRGFSLNVSNTRINKELTGYGEKLSDLLGGKHYIIDSSRNGGKPYEGDDMPWCNPPGAKLGEKPHVTENEGHLDAMLWVKNPGESDEQCRNAPKAGDFWNDYAYELVK